MDEIIEQYGSAFLRIIAIVGTLVILVSCIGTGGILNTAIQTYMRGICG